MGLKNYTTSIKVDKTISEIERRLANFGATHIYKVYSEGVPSGIAFTLLVGNASMVFKLPMRKERILKIFKTQVSKGQLPKRYINDAEQVARTGWRIIKDWIDSQLALIEIEFVKLEEVFLPYIYDSKNDETFFEKVQKRGVVNLLEENKNDRL